MSFFSISRTHHRRHARAVGAMAALAALLCGCGGGGGGDGGTPVVTVPPPVGVPPAPPPTSLLTDSELVTGADTRAARTDADAVAWFAENAQIIRSLTADDDFSDLTFLAPLVQSKSMVLLGESSHGVREYSVAKTRLIKFLHETQGFNVLAFEGGVFDCETAQDVIVSLGAREAMRSCLFGVWQTQTLLDLFEYVRETQSTTRPLRLTGFDTQISGTRFARRAGRTAALLAKVSPDRAALARQLEDDFRFLIFNAQNATAATDPGMVNLRDAQTRLDTEFAALSDDLRANAALITADGEFSVADVLLAAQYTATSPLLARQVTQRFELGAGGVPRDEGMAQNLIGLATAIYPDEKIIVWAHNAHLRHRGTGFLPERNMGSLVHAALADRMYTIGFYMYRGEHAFNDRRVVPVSAPQNFSLEAIFHSRRLAWLFLDLENAQRTPGHEWIDAATPTWAWGQWETTLRLSEEYDGLVILDSVQSPVYID